MAKHGKAQRACVARKTSKNIREGRPRQQAIAIAFRQCGVARPRGSKK